LTNASRSWNGILSVIAVCCICGCSQTPAPDPQGEGAAPAGSDAGAPVATGASQMTLTVGMIFGDAQTFPNPDVAAIEKHVRAKNWTNTEERPYLQLARSGANRTSVLKVQGTLGTPNVDGPFRAVLLLYNADGSAWGSAESPPLESVDSALELLLLFRNDVEKLKTVARQWKGEFAQ